MTRIDKNTANNQISAYENDAANGKFSAAKLDQEYKTATKTVDTMESQGMVTADQAKQMKSDLSSMHDVQGASDGAAQWNAATSDLNSLLDQSTGKVAAGKQDLTTATGANAVGSLLGDGSTPFAQMMGTKYGIDTTQGAADVASQMAAKGIELTTDKDGNAITYDPSSRTVGGFGADGSSVATPSALYDSKTSLSQMGTSTFTVGSMTATFGNGGTDSKGNKYGLDIAQNS